MVAKASQIWQTILSLLLLSTTLKFVVAHSTHKTTECFCLREDKHDGHDHDGENGNTKEVLTYKIVAIVTILLASALGVFLPILGKNIPALRPERGTFILVKAYSAGIILCTAFIHILPEAFENLTSPCLGHDTPWDNFPFTGLAVMLGSLLTLVMDSMGSRHYSMSLLQDSNAANKEATDAYNNHGHGHCVTSTALPEGVSKEELIRFRITSHVLEIGIVVHSVIIGLSMGTSQKLDTIKPLIAALCFHQFFEGIGLGGCIVQASFKLTSTILMAVFFSITTPLGIAIGIGITNIYDETSSIALIVQGLLNSIAAGILIYMALVDLLAADFMNPKIQSNAKLFFGAKFTLVLGVASMAIMAIWA